MVTPAPGHQRQTPPQRVAVVGGGWAGLAAAVRAATDGHHVTVYEASRQWGGRARSLPLALPNGQVTQVDNGQHILIGAYTHTLRLMQQVGVDTNSALLRLPLTLLDPMGHGLRLPHSGSFSRALNPLLPLNVLVGVLTARGWTWRDKRALLTAATGWRIKSFRCPPGTTVAQLCKGMPPSLRQRFIDPLCISALNTPTEQASGQVFLRVLRDALFSTPGGADLLLPRTDLGALFPDAAARWLKASPRNADMRLGERVTELLPLPSGRWQVNTTTFDRVVWANYPSKTALSLIHHALTALNSGKALSAEQQHWLDCQRALRFESIATMYAWATPDAPPLPQPMLALWPSAQCPAQFVFDKGQLGGPAGLWAFVVSASDGDAQTLSSQVVAQAKAQLGAHVMPLKTVVEKRATFACTPGLQRPSQLLAAGLSSAGDHTEGPYPATLEGAVRSGWQAAATQP